MALTERVRRYLAQQQVPHDVLPHRETFTAQEVAEAAHVSGQHLAKALLVEEEGGGRLMAVLPAPCRLDLTALKAASGRRRLHLASEETIQRVFSDCEVGAMPPFGNLYDLPVFLDSCFPRSGEFIFQAGNHHEVVRMRHEDYERLVGPASGEFCLHAREKVMSE